MHIVTANYLDRSQRSARWMLRGQDDGAKKVKAVGAIVASNVVFDLPDHGTPEAKAGCISVAYCETARPISGDLTFDEPEDALVRVNYKWGQFCDPDNRFVRSCEKLYLSTDGVIYALNPSSKVRERPKSTVAA